MEDDIPSLPTRPKLTYRFGKRPSNDPHEYKTWEYLHEGVHKSTNQEECSRISSANYNQGLRHTKFNKGFFRRSKDLIDSSCERRNFSEAKERARTVNSANRRHKLLQLSTSCGYNIINGSNTCGRLDVMKQPRIQLEQTVKNNLEHEGCKYLKNSSNRFYMNQNNAPCRQDILTREGLIAEKSSSIIQIGRAEMPSCGVAEALCKSTYIANLRRSSSRPTTTKGAVKREISRNASGNQVSKDIQCVKNLPNY